MSEAAAYAESGDPETMPAFLLDTSLVMVQVLLRSSLLLNLLGCAVCFHFGLSFEARPVAKKEQSLAQKYSILVQECRLFESCSLQ
jgi:hypothetical protein